MIEICLTVLDKSVNYKKDPVLDVSQRNDPLYVCRVIHGTVSFNLHYTSFAHRHDVTKQEGSAKMAVARNIRGVSYFKTKNNMES